MSKLYEQIRLYPDHPKRRKGHPNARRLISIEDAHKFLAKAGYDKDPGFDLPSAFAWKSVGGHGASVELHTGIVTLLTKDGMPIDARTSWDFGPCPGGCAGCPACD